MLPLQDLSGLTREDRNSSHGLLLRLEAAVHYGVYSLDDYLRAVPVEPLGAVCRQLGIPEDDALDQTIQGIDDFVRYQALECPSLTEDELPQSLSEDLTSRERLLILELHTRLMYREPATTHLPVAEIAGRLGYVDEELTVSLGALERAGTIFSANGLTSEPDLTSLRDVPSLEDPVVIRQQSDWILLQSPEQEIPERTAPAGDAATERAFLAWVLSRLDSRPKRVATFRLSDLVNRLGRYRADRRLRATAVVDIADFLHRHGIEMTPDYRQVERGPGIDTLVRLRRQDTADGRAPEPSTRSSTEDPVLEYALKLGMAMARADDDLDESEVAELHRHALRRLTTHSQQELEAVDAIIEGLRSESIDVSETAERIAEDLTSEEQQQLLEYLFDVAVADGVFLPQEEALLRQLHHRLRFDVDYFERLVRLCQATAKNTGAVEAPRRSLVKSAPSTSRSSRQVTPPQIEEPHSAENIRLGDATEGHVVDRHEQRAARLYSLLTAK